MAKSRVIAAYVFVCFSFLLLFIRYGYLQLVDYGFLFQQSVNNYSSMVSTLPVRGSITDRNGVILADNTVSYVVAAMPKNLKNSDELLQKLSPYVNITELDIEKFRAMRRNSKNYDWVIIKDDLSNIEVANLTAHSYEYPEVSVYAHTKRYYPFDEVYSHSLGYVGRVSTNDRQKMAKNGSSQRYLASDYIGKNGIEQFYESTLRGQMGRKVIKTDALGNEVGLVENAQASDGYTLQLTIDNSLQKLAWQLLGSHQGAIVALDPNSGGVLAFVSKPSFDPNWFIDGISVDDWSSLREDPDKPLLNRAAQGTYPPGSTFKPFMALAALYLGVRTPNSTMNDPGYFMIPGSTHKFRSSSGALGLINMLRAITYSSDTYFYKMGLDMGIDKIDKVMPLFGFGQKTGIDLPQENSGLLPSKEWKNKRFSSNKSLRAWQAADSVTVGVGQGFNHYTPLQMAFATSIIANNGIVHTPHFLDKVIDKNGKVVESYTITSSTIPIPVNEIEFVKNAMQSVMSEGTAKVAGHNLKYTMAGKTGTAQVVALRENSHQAKFAGAKYRDHSWFIAFAPVDHPKIAVAIIMENGGWGAASAPIARSMFDSYLLGESRTNSTTQYRKFTPESSVITDDIGLFDESTKEDTSL